MATIATCPQCAAQLALPEPLAAGSRGKCPQCEAEFSLDEMIQISLPSVRVLEAVVETDEPEVSDVEVREEPEAASEPVGDEADLGTGVLDEAAPQKTLADWEARLKHAIDTTGGLVSDEPEPPTEIAASEPKTDPLDLHFEVELDPPPAAEHPPVTEQAIDQHQAAVSVLESMPVPRLGEPTAGDAVLPPADDSAPPTLNAAPRRPAKRRWLPKLVAMLLFGPLLGGLLGLYALLWIKGPSGDVFGLAQYLPASMLPSSLAPAMAKSPVDVATSKPPTTEPAKSPASPPLRVDDDVQPATAQQDVTDPAARQSNVLAEVEPLITAAIAAAPDLMTGDLLTRESKRRKGQAYMALCRLAEQMNVVAELADDPAARDQVAAARRVFRQVAASGDARVDLAKIAMSWWEFPGRSNSGIFLVGEIRAARPIGAGTLCQLVLDEQLSDRPVAVLLPRRTYPVGDRIGVAGAIVADPQTVIAGFDATLPQVVVAYESYSLNAQSSAL